MTWCCALRSILLSATSLLCVFSASAQDQDPPELDSQLPASVTERLQRVELVSLTRRLIGIRSDYDEGVMANHGEMAAFLAGYLRELGMEVHVVEPTPSYPTVVGRLRGARDEPTLGLLAHYNTVTVGDRTKWKVDPFAAKVDRDRIYGLGASDQKAPIAATLLATRAVLEAGIPLQGTLVHLFIPGEGAQVHSLPFIVEQQPEILKADWHLDTEGGPDIVQISGGWTWVKVRVDGVGGHTGGSRADGKPGRPVNAIFKLAKVLGELERIDQWMTYEAHPLFYKLLYGGTPVVEAGKIEGGYKVNQVPDWAEAQVDIRLVPGQSPDGVLTQMRALIARLQEEDPELEVSVEPMTTQWAPLHYWETLTDDDPFVRAIREVAPDYVGRAPGWTGSIGGGRPDLWATGAKWVNFGIAGSGENGRAPNEYASIESGMNRVRLYAALVLRMLR